MASVFPSPQWVADFCQKLNSDPRYSETAKKWESDITFVIEPSGPIGQPLYYYFDLWHGGCRRAEILESMSVKSAYIMSAPYENMVKVLTGELHPMTALMTRKLSVQGNMAVLMRNIPVILEFVRCAQEITTETLT
jgi:putative sterol carrier protein